MNSTCCAERVETWPMLFETIRSKDSATSCALNDPHIAIEAARDSATRNNPGNKRGWGYI